jgi:hypothetical protein
MSTAAGGLSIVKDGLVLYMDAANPKSIISGSTIWTDLSKEANSGILTNGAIFSSFNRGSIQFDGANDFIYAGASPSLQTQQFTYCFWAYPLLNALTLKGSSLLSGAPQFRIQGTTTGNLILIKQNVIALPESTTPVNFNQWNYLCVSYSSPIVSYYINGVSAGVASSSQIFTNFGNMWIGARTASTEFFKGNIATVQIYNKVLTDAEILQNYNTTKSRYGL